MRFPFLNPVGKADITITTFGGYNSNAKIAENEFSDMQNLSGDSYPLLATRKHRGLYRANTAVYGMINKDALCIVAGKGAGAVLYVNGYEIAGFNLSASEKQLVSMGAYLIVFPDKKWINTKDFSDCGNIDANYFSQGTVTYTLCRSDATEYPTPTVSDTAPANPDDGDMWIDTSSAPHVPKQYSETSGEWTEIVTTYIKISASGIAEDISRGDSVSISNSVVDINGDGIYIEDALHTSSGAGDYIVIAGIVDAIATQSSAINVRRRMPAVDFVVESNNRLWGCRYGFNNKGEVVNEIYASKLGDFKNWNCFQGLSTDSYAASLGSDGPFTGACTYKGYPMFWKEECFHKVYGDYPANFQITATACDGVQKGSGKSLAIVDSVLYYKSHSGVFAYDGSLPEKASYAIEDGYINAVAGGIGTKYYISMAKNGTYSLFVYNSAKNLWHKEDGTPAKCFCTVENELYMAAESTIYTLNGSGDALSDDAPEWSFTSGLLGMDTPARKYISNVILRMHLNGSATVYIQYDESGTWSAAASVSGDDLTYNLPLRLKRCDCFRIKAVGSGEFKLYSLTKTMMNGSKKV